MLDMCKTWATKFDYDCVAANGMFQLIHTGTSTRVAILLTLNFDMLIHIRNLPEGTSIIIDKVMAEAVSRVLGASLVSAYDFNLNKLLLINTTTMAFVVTASTLSPKRTSGIDRIRVPECRVPFCYRVAPYTEKNRDRRKYSV